jgi:geranylgeranyl diphosphate synthase type I
MLQDACLSLTQGQFLDISFENRKEMSLSAYWRMVDGKTATLLATATNIGALVARAGESACEAYRSFGRSLGFAFQAQDDLLGIWGDAVLTGKSAASDLLSRKKTLPVIYGLQQNAEFARRWMGGPITAEDVPLLAELLEREGARAYTEERAHQLTEQALTALEEACPRGEAGQGLRETAQKLLGRKG